MSEPWQLRALSYYDVIGEIRFASQFYAKLISRVRYYPARQNEDGTTEPILDGPPVEILHQVQDPGGGRSRLQYDYGRMMFVTGEGVLFADEREGVQQWRFLWKDEVKPLEDGSELWQRIRYDQQPYAPPQVGRAYRFWTPHPRHSDLADSPLRSVMDIAEELLALTASVMGTATTRRTNGMLLMPSEISPNQYGAPGDDDYLGDEDPLNNPFLGDLVEHLSAQIDKPATAEAKVPYLLEGPAEYLPLVRWLPFYDVQIDYAERELRTEAIKRLATGMDFPPEFLLGMSEANHWTARQVVYDMWRSYGSPIAERFGDDLADTVLRPMLRDDGYPDWENVVIAFDDSQVVISPDRSTDALQAWRDGLVSGKRARLDIGYTEADKPTEEEHEEWLAIKMRDPQILPDEYAPPLRGPMPSTELPAQAEDGPPEPARGRDGSREESLAASAEIRGAALAALMRCRELAGVRIKRRCEECEGESLSVVASTAPSHYLADRMDLVKGGAAIFGDLLRERGCDSTQVTAVCQQLEVYAARTLHEARCPSLPSGLVASIEKAMEVSDALVDRAA